MICSPNYLADRGAMRYRAPAREQIDPAVFARRPLVDWSAYAEWLQGKTWPDLAQLNAARPQVSPRFVAQDAALLADGLHYEQRIAERGQIATREHNWHDLFNALIWLRYPAIKRALNQRQVSEIARNGPKIRSREQYALTHFDEAGVIVRISDPVLLALWNSHDWFALFWHERNAWRDGRIQLMVFGHALLEHALQANQLLVGKALVVAGEASLSSEAILLRVAQAINDGKCLFDPLDLRPLPLSGLPGWMGAGEHENYHRANPSYRPLREGRCYPPALLG